MKDERLSDDEQIRRLLLAVIHRAVWDWKALTRHGLPLDASHKTLRAVDHGMQPRDARSLIEFFNSMTVERLLDALHLPMTLDDIRRQLHIPGMGDFHS